MDSKEFHRKTHLIYVNFNIKVKISKKWKQRLRLENEEEHNIFNEESTDKCMEIYYLRKLLKIRTKKYEKIILETLKYKLIEIYFHSIFKDQFTKSLS